MDTTVCDNQRVSENIFLNNFNDARSSVISYLICLNDGREVAEDIAQQAAVTAWQHRSKLKDSRRFKAWFFRIALNTRSNIQRVKRRREELVPMKKEIASGDERVNIDNNYHYRPKYDLVLDIKKTLDELDEQSRELILDFWNGKNRDEMAEERRISSACLRKRLERAKKKFRQIYLSLDK